MGGNTVTTRETVTSERLGKVRRSEFDRMNSEGIQAIAELQAQIAAFKSLKGRERDLFYLREVGVAGHQSLEDLMTRVESQAKDASLKQLATLSLPLIRAHLQVSEDVGNELRATALGGT